MSPCLPSPSKAWYFWQGGIQQNKTYLQKNATHPLIKHCQLFKNLGLQECLGSSTILVLGVLSLVLQTRQEAGYLLPADALTLLTRSLLLQLSRRSRLYFGFLQRLLGLRGMCACSRLFGCSGACMLHISRL